MRYKHCYSIGDEDEEELPGGIKIVNKAEGIEM